MLRKVLSRAPFPPPVAIKPLKGLSAARVRELKATGYTLTFVSKGQMQGESLAGCLPPGFKGAAGEVGFVFATPRRLSEAGGARALLAGLGPRCSIRDYRLALTNAVREAHQKGLASLTVHPPSTDVFTERDVFHPPQPLSKADVVEKTACYSVAAAYRYDRLRTIAIEAGSDDDRSAATPQLRGRAHKKGQAQATAVNLFIATDLTAAVHRGATIGACINDARNLGNLREDEGVPALYVEWARRHLLPHGVRLRKVLRGEQIRQAGLNLLYSVGKGSIREPYVLVLEYIGNRRAAQSIALVGKGVTFDCGGHNIKPYGAMESMHTDMMGAATVLATLKAAAMLKLPVNLVGAVGLVENAIGPDSYFPSTILTSLKGTTVEVLNTDAEGRLVLADLLTYVQRHVKLEKTPHTIVDLATLTGAIVVGLGDRRAGLFSNSARLSEKLMATGTACGEELWPMPVGDEHVDLMKGTLSDLVNVAPGREAGACNAAAFLAHFIEPGREWAHLDIAGVANAGSKPKGFNAAGVTAYGVSLLLDFLRQK